MIKYLFSRILEPHSHFTKEFRIHEVLGNRTISDQPVQQNVYQVDKWTRYNRKAFFQKLRVVHVSEIKNEITNSV